MNEFNYFSLVRKLDNKEVYTSLAYTLDNSTTLDYRKIKKTLNYYFERVNNHLMQQMQNPKLSIEEKLAIKLLDVNDYIVKCMKLTPNGVAPFVYWQKDAKDFLV